MNRGTLFWGTILVLGGLLLLGDNLGLFASLNINIWSLIWPTFLILLGIWTLLGVFWRPAASIQPVRVSREGASQGRVRLNHGAGRLHITAGNEPELLVAGECSGGVDVSTKREGQAMKVRISTAVQFFPFTWTPGTSLDWDLALNREIPLVLKVESGASESRLDLTDLKVTELVVKSGASSVEVALPAHAGQSRADFQTGAASVKISVPSGVAARIQSQGGLSSTRVDTNRFPSVGGVYLSPDFDSAVDRVDIRVEMGVGSVEVY